MKAKKITALLMTLIMLVSVCGVFAVTVSAEAATADTTWYTDETAGKEYTLTTPAQFLGFIQLIHAGKTFEGQTIKIGADINLTGNVINAATLTTGFWGTLDGQNHKVTGVTYDLFPTARVNDAALFGVIAEGKTATIQNLYISGNVSNIESNQTLYSWRSAGFYNKSAGTLICDNVYNELNVYGSAHLGAFLGTASGNAITRFTNCVFAGTITGNNSDSNAIVGGFAANVGGAEFTVENCAMLGVAKQVQGEQAAGFAARASATVITFKNNLFAGEVYQGNNLTGRYYAYGITDTNVSKECVNNLYVPCGNTIINSASPKLMPVVAADGTVTFPEQSTPRYKVDASLSTGAAAAGVLASYGMTDWVATTEGKPLPATIATMLAADVVAQDKDVDRAVDYLGYQTKTEDTTGSIRFIGHVDALSYEKIGLKYTVEYMNIADAEKLTGKLETNDVYTGFAGATEIYTNTDEEQPYYEEYFMLLVLEGLQTDKGAVLVNVETFYVEDGAEVKCDTYTFVAQF